MNYFIDQNTDFTEQIQAVLGAIEGINDAESIVHITLRMLAESIGTATEFDGERFNITTCSALDEKKSLKVCEDSLEDFFLDYICADKKQNNKVIDALKNMVSNVEQCARDTEARFEK